MLAFVFPGQGSQRPGMGVAWQNEPSWELIESAAATSSEDLIHLLTEADADELTQTHNAQLATFAMSMTVLHAVERVGLVPAMSAGHSLGEYTALVAAGAVSFEHGSALVGERGRVMQLAADDTDGTMAAIIGLSEEDVDVACRRANADVWVANFNAPGQVIIAGAPEAIEVAGEYAKELGARKIMRFPVGGAFHTPYMSSAREPLKKAIINAQFVDPKVPVYANVDGRPHPSAHDWPELLSAQLCAPVRFRQMILRMVDDGASRFIEIGPGGVLGGLIRRIVPDVPVHSVATPEDLDLLVEALAQKPELSDYRREHAGEHLYMSERLVVSPTTGLFTPNEDYKDDEQTPVGVGAVLGQVGNEEVKSPFAGLFMGRLALTGERVTKGQPIAWLRA